MSPTPVAKPTVLTNAGYLFTAPLGSTLPSNTVAGSVFTDAWPVAWVPLGATDDGSEFSYSTKIEAINVAEFFDPIAYATTERSGSIAFNLANFCLTNWSIAMNGAPLTVVSGTGATQLNKVEPGAVGTETRRMLGYESLDNTFRIVMYQVVNGSEIKSAFKKAPAIATIPVQFQFELPTSGIPFSMFSAGTARG